MHNKHKGHAAVILCNGPSLLAADLDVLSESKTITFGLNKINLLYPKTALRPNYIVAVNPYVIMQSREFINNTETQLFLDHKVLKLGIRSRENVSFLHSVDMPGTFAADCSFSVFQGFTVTYVALQLAYHMGFVRVALIGCDHDFVDKGPANQVVVSGEKDNNHFDPGYFSGGDEWQSPDLLQSEISYQFALKAFQDDGRKLYNATEGGKLEIFPRIDLQNFLEIT
ncbi:MAG: hypothetical protein CMP14_11735 [Rickettsiales bacterium]|nr:hypothetical protein [Rickettsiales bacterium]